MRKCSQSDRAGEIQLSENKYVGTAALGRPVGQSPTPPYLTFVIPAPERISTLSFRRVSPANKKGDCFCLVILSEIVVRQCDRKAAEGSCNHKSVPSRLPIPTLIPR